MFLILKILNGFKLFVYIKVQLFSYAFFRKKISSNIQGVPRLLAQILWGYGGHHKDSDLDTNRERKHIYYS